jgi:hypothetical protein
MAKKPYKVNITPLPVSDNDDIEGGLNLFDPTNPDISLFNMVDDELIKLGGSKLNYYKFYRDEGYDDVYLEYRDKAIAKQPLIVWGHYEPREIEENLGQFGLELQNDQLFIFNKSYIERRIGRIAVPGDVIKPFFQEMKFEVYEVQEASFEVYGVYHLLCHARLLRDSEEIQDTPLTDVVDDVPGFGGDEGDKW